LIVHLIELKVFVTAKVSLASDTFAFINHVILILKANLTNVKKKYERAFTVPGDIAIIHLGYKR